MILGSGGAIEEIEAALQNVGGGDAIDDFGAALSRHVMSDHLASDSGGRHPLIPKNDRQVTECQQIPRELAYGLGAGAVDAGER